MVNCSVIKACIGADIRVGGKLNRNEGVVGIDIGGKCE